MRLYKYCDAGGIEVLRSNSIKVSSPSEFNDPFDCNPIPDAMTPASRAALKTLVKDELEASEAAKKGAAALWMLAGGSSVSYLNALEESLEKTVNDARLLHSTMMLSMDQLAILCLSAQRNNHLMWAHYGDRHRGLVIELESNGIFQMGDDSTIHNRLVPVRYSDDRPSFRYDDPLAAGPFRTKGKAWSYEDEWRVIYHQTQFIPRVVCGRELHLRPLPPENIRTVLLGSKMPDSHRREVRRLLSDGHYSHVQLVQMEMDPSSYLIREVPITFV